MAKSSKARKTSKRPPAARANPSGSDLFLHEIKAFPARFLADLPLPVTLWLELPGSPVPVCFTTAAEPFSDETVLAPAVVFHRDELTALVVGTESERLWRKELLGFCFEKWRRPALRITESDTLHGANASPAELAWSFERVLDRLGATLVRVELADARAHVGMSVAA